jgi:hypothetical protein
MDEAWARWQLEELPIAEAAEESGLSVSALEKQIARGALLNSGDKGRPRIRRCDLPRKPGMGPRGPREAPDLAERVLDGMRVS